MSDTFGSSLKAGDTIVVSHRGQQYKKVVDYTAPFDCDPKSQRKYVYFTDGTNLQPDDGATFEVTDHVCR